MWFDKLTMSGARLLPLTLSLSMGAANSDRSFEMVSNTLSAGRNVTVPGG
jgi:hypothetical protein